MIVALSTLWNSKLGQWILFKSPFKSAWKLLTSRAFLTSCHIVIEFFSGKISPRLSDDNFHHLWRCSPTTPPAHYSHPYTSKIPARTSFPSSSLDWLFPPDTQMLPANPLCVFAEKMSLHHDHRPICVTAPYFLYFIPYIQNIMTQAVRHHREHAALKWGVASSTFNIKLLLLFFIFQLLKWKKTLHITEGNINSLFFALWISSVTQIPAK